VKRALLLLACCLVGCATTTPRAHLLEHAAFENENRYWAVGSSGRAELFENGSLTPWDYPMDPDLEDFYYEPAGDVPTASVHVIGGKPYLFTRAGDIFFFQGGWQRFRHRIPSERGDDRPQIDHVLVGPGDRIHIHIHSDVILSGTLADFASGDFQRREAPTFFTHMDAIGTRLFGIGWDESGYVRQLFESERAGFRRVVSLGRDGWDEMVGTLALDDGSPVAVLRGGLVPGYSSTELAPFQGAVELLSRDPEHVPRTRANTASISRVFASAPGRALLAYEQKDGGQNVVELHGRDVRVYRCSHMLGADPIGAYPRERGFRLVTSSGRPFDVPGPDCLERNQVASEPSPLLEVPR
jgi:hypothetical protein